MKGDIIFKKVKWYNPLNLDVPKTGLIFQLIYIFFTFLISPILNILALLTYPLYGIVVEGFAPDDD